MGTDQEKVDDSVAEQKLIRQVTEDVIRMECREDKVAELKSKVSRKRFRPGGSQIAQAMIEQARAERLK